MAKKQARNEFARDIWLAGLGAFAVAQNEGGKVFDQLVKEGSKVEKKTKKDVNKTVVNLREEVEARLSGAKQAAGVSVSKLEKIFEQRVAQVLGRFGVPTSDDVQALAKRVADLSKEVKALNGGKKVVAKKPAAKKATKKVAKKTTKKAPTRRAA